MPISQFPTGLLPAAKTHMGARAVAGLQSNIQNRLGPILDSHDEHGVADMPFISGAIEAIDPGTAALAGLRRAAEAKRIVGTENRAGQLATNERFAFDEAGLDEGLDDFRSERGAGRAFLPNADRLFDRSRQAAGEDAFARYTQPAMIKANADLDAASIAGESSIAAAKARRPVQPNEDERTRELILKGLLEAAATKFDPKQLDQMRQYFGGLQR